MQADLWCCILDVLCSPSYKSQDAIGPQRKARMNIRNHVVCTPGFSWSRNAALYIIVLNEAVPAEGYLGNLSFVYSMDSFLVPVGHGLKL
jgi:hypothetical protein